VIRTSDPAVICQRGYATRTRQELTSAEWSVRRAQVIGAYGLARNPGEVDHFLPLEGGGTNDVENLWPESAPQYKAKDAAERGLHAGICKPGVTVAKAQALQRLSSSSGAARDVVAGRAAPSRWRRWRVPAVRPPRIGDP